jgi:tetratricopeptide (TPR) repeat protein
MIQKNIKISNKILFIAILILSGLIVYFNSFSNKLFWDDNDNIVNNVYVHNWQYFPKYFSENLIAGAGLLSNYWRPILLIVFSIEWHLAQNSPYLYHFFNVVVHISNAILLFLLILKLFSSENLAFLSALIFLIHPLQTESVTYVSGLSGPLSFLFLNLGFLSYLKGLESKKTYKSWHYYLSLFLLILALMTREEMIIAPLLFALVAIFFYFQKTNQNIKKIIFTLLPFFAIVLVYGFLRITILHFEDVEKFYPPIFAENIFVRIVTFLRIFLIYLGLIFFPKDLHMERSINIITSINFGAILGFLIFLILVTLALIYFKKRPVFSFGIFWFLISLSIHSNIIIIKSAFLYEHWLYIALFGLFLSLFDIFYQISLKNQTTKIIFTCLFIIFALLLGVRTIIRNNDWKDPITFYQQTLKFAPSSYRVLNNLGMSYADEQKFEEAKYYYQKAIEIDPKNAVAYHNLANVLSSEGDFNQAEEMYKKAIALDEKFYPAYAGLLRLYTHSQNSKAAEDLIQKYKEIFKN